MMTMTMTMMITMTMIMMMMTMTMMRILINPIGLFFSSWEVDLDGFWYLFDIGVTIGISPVPICTCTGNWIVWWWAGNRIVRWWSNRFGWYDCCNCTLITIFLDICKKERKIKSVQYFKILIKKSCPYPWWFRDKSQFVVVSLRSSTQIVYTIHTLIQTNQTSEMVLVRTP